MSLFKIRSSQLKSRLKTKLKSLRLLSFGVGELKRFLLRIFSVIVSLGALVVLLLLSACDVETQKGREAFVDGKLPKILQKFADQLFELEPFEKEIVARAEAEKQDPNIIEVGVIDCGVDLGLLKDVIAFDIEDGKLKGAGHDSMGNDRFASANLIRPDLFAFGAKDVVDGKILDPVEDPLALLETLNKKFMDALVAKIQASPDLKDTQFKKISPDNLTLYGASTVLEAFEDSGLRDSLKRYEKLIQEGKLIGSDVKADYLAHPEEIDFNEAFFVAQKKWDMAIELGLPYFGIYSSPTQFLQLKGWLPFLEILKETLKTFDGAQQFAAGRANLIKYYDSRSSSPGQDMSAAKEKTNSSLVQGHLFARYGSRIFDELLTLRRKLTDFIVLENPNRPEMLDENFVIDQAMLEKALAKADQRAQTLLEEYEKLKTNSDTRKKLNSLKARMGATKELVAWFRQDRGISFSSLPTLSSNELARADYRRSGFFKQHPYLSTASAEAIHATHVASTIAGGVSIDSQGKPTAETTPSKFKVRIVPVRVTTQGVMNSPEESARMQKKFLENFESWLKNPIVFRALGAKLKTGLSELNFADESEENRSAVAKKLLGEFAENIGASFEKRRLDYIFFDELKSAVKYLGRRKLPLVNISLGTKFEVPVMRAEAESREELIENAFNFFQFEYFKFSLAQAIQQYAPRTLFAIAAGNEGNWFNGKSRSAIPVSLDSPTLRPFERADKGEVAPNNHLQNILAVGSVGPTYDLSSFTNVPLGQRVPLIFGKGEAVLARIKSTSAEGFKQLVANKFVGRDELAVLSVSNDLLDPLFEREGQGLQLPPGQGPASLVKDQYKGALNLITSAVEAATQYAAIARPVKLAYLAGTSMATPNVIRELTVLMGQEAEKNKMTFREFRESVMASPTEVIKLAMAHARPIGDGQVESGPQFWMLQDTKEWQPDREMTAFKEQIEELKKRGSGVTSFVGICSDIVANGDSAKN